MPATLVRPRPSVTMVPRSILTPSASSPSPSTLPTDADGRDQALGREPLALAAAEVDVRGHACWRLCRPCHLGAGQDLHALLLERLACQRGDLGVLDGQDLRQQLDDRHLGAERAVERCELDADRARAHDEQRLGHGLRHHGLEVGPDAVAVGLDAGQHARARTGGDDDVLRLVGAGARVHLWGRDAAARIGLLLRRSDHRDLAGAWRWRPRPRSRRPCSS